jgi:hypothetical protein
VVVKPRDDLRAVLDGSIESAGQQQARAAFAAAAAACWPAAAGPRSMTWPRVLCFVMISLHSHAVPSFTRQLSAHSIMYTNLGFVCVPLYVYYCNCAMKTQFYSAWEEWRQESRPNSFHSNSLCHSAHPLNF